MCNGDVSLAYYWNRNFTVVAEDGTKSYSDWYLSMTPAERFSHILIYWDVTHQCRNFDLIKEWVADYGDATIPFFDNGTINPNPEVRPPPKGYLQ